MQGKAQTAKGCYGDGSFKTRGRGGGRCWPNPLCKNSLRLLPASFPMGPVTLVPMKDREVGGLRDFKKEGGARTQRDKGTSCDGGEQRGSHKDTGGEGRQAVLKGPVGASRALRPSWPSALNAWARNCPGAWPFKAGPPACPPPPLHFT